MRPRSYTSAEDEVKPKPSELRAGSNSDGRAVGRGTLRLPAGQKALSCDLCPSSLLKPAQSFLFALFFIAFWHITCPQTDLYTIIFDIAFAYMTVQGSGL